MATMKLYGIGTDGVKEIIKAMPKNIIDSDVFHYEVQTGLAKVELAKIEDTIAAKCDQEAKLLDKSEKMSEDMEKLETVQKQIEKLELVRDKYLDKLSELDIDIEFEISRFSMLCVFAMTGTKAITFSGYADAVKAVRTYEKDRTDENKAAAKQALIEFGQILNTDNENGIYKNFTVSRITDVALDALARLSLTDNDKLKWNKSGITASKFRPQAWIQEVILYILADTFKFDARAKKVKRQSTIIASF